jgi:transposase-like protein
MDVYRGHLYNDAPSAGSLAGYRFDRKVVEARAAKMRTFRHSEETKQRISDMAKGRPAHNKGHALSVEHRAKLSVAASSRAPASSATREKQGANMRRRFATGWKPPARKTRRFDANDQQKLKEMYERDPQVSVTAIAKAIGGVKRHTVSKYLKLAGVDISQRTIKRPSPNEIERRNLRLAKAKLSKEQVAAVRNLSASGRSISKLAADFKVSKPVIRRVVRNQSPYNDAVFVTSAS